MFALKDRDISLLRNQKPIMYLVNVCRSGLQIDIHIVKVERLKSTAW